MDLEIRYSREADGTKRAAIPDRTRAWAIAFIKEHAAKSVSDIEAVVQAGHDAIRETIAGLSDEQAQTKPTADDWSVLEVMAHVVTTKQVIVGLCRSLGAGARPPGAGPEWEEESAQDGITTASFTSVTAALEAADAAHGDLVAFIRGLDEADMEVRFKHYLFGALNAREWAVFQRVHDGDHLPQMERLVAWLRE